MYEVIDLILKGLVILMLLRVVIAIDDLNGEDDEK